MKKTVCSQPICIILDINKHIMCAEGPYVGLAALSLICGTPEDYNTWIEGVSWRDGSRDLVIYLFIVSTAQVSTATAQFLSSVLKCGSHHHVMTVPPTIM